MLHLLLPQPQDLTFLRKVKEVLEEKLNSEWAELGQWFVLSILMAGSLFRVICGWCSGCKKDQLGPKDVPLQELEALTGPSAPRLYPKFRN